MIAHKIKVTTTSGFNNVIIEKYLEPVTAHVVVGMNLFKDFFGSLTDIFGGKSKTYQNTLSSINEEVINELRKKAYHLGGNCILSLKIDNDEVSAQGKSMMMVSAIGTVAIANFPKESYSNNKLDSLNKDKSSRISNEHLKIIQEKEQYIRECKSESIVMDDDFWIFVKKFGVSELANYILNNFINYFRNFIEYRSEETKDLFNNTSEYFLIIDQNISIKLLYDKIKESISSDARNELINLIKETKLINYSAIIGLLKNQDLYIQKAGLLLAISEKEYYDKSDIQSIKEVTKVISSSFQQRGEKSTKKKALSSKLIEIWICDCDKENSINNKYCSYCKRDIFGFEKGEETPSFYIQKLSNIERILIDNVL